MNRSPYFTAIYNIASIMIFKFTIADKKIAAMGIYIFLFHLYFLFNSTIFEAYAIGRK